MQYKKILLVLMPLSLTSMAGCAAISSQPSLSPPETLAISAICTKIMHLSKGETGYSSCTESLGDSLASSLSVDPTLVNRQECLLQGYQTGTAELATCVLDRERTHPETLSYPAVADLAEIDRVAAADTSPSSYYGIAPRESYRREQYSCAQLGFAPISASFSQCVADLSAAMFADAHPPT